MKARSTYVAALVAVAVIVVVSGKSLQLSRIPDEQAEAEGKALAEIIDHQPQSNAPLKNQAHDGKQISTTGGYPFLPPFDTSFDHRIIRMRPRSMIIFTAVSVRSIEYASCAFQHVLIKKKPTSA